MRQPSTNNNHSSKKNKQHQMSARYSHTHVREIIIILPHSRYGLLIRGFVIMYVLWSSLSVCRNVSAYEVSSSQAVLSPQRSKRVKENTPPRCAVLQNGSTSNCLPSQSCGGGSWGVSEADQTYSTTRDHQHHVPRQTIIIPDTPSPAVSVITISSDTDEEEDHKQNNK